MSILTVIPAKIGSTRLPRKNILPLGGKPLMHWIIKTAIEADCCGEIMVSTESEEVAKIARQAGASTPFMRPEYLSKDPYEVYDVCKHVLDEYEKMGRTFETLILLMVTSPFCSAQDIQGALKLYEETDAQSVHTVSRFHSNIYSAQKIDDQGRLSPIFQEYANTPPCERPKAYEFNGAVAVVSVAALREQKTLSCKPTHAYLTDWWRSVDINSEADFEYASYLLEKGFIKNRL